MERQASTDQSSFQPTPLQPLAERDRGADGKLPWPVASLIGREQEIIAVHTMLERDEVRLLTFTGPGGVGKTQLALAVARAEIDVFTGGVIFVPLARLNDPSLVTQSIAQAIDVRDSGARPLLYGLQSAIGERKLLLLLDNFEHVIEAASVVVDLLTKCPNLKVLVTSRELLHVSGEHAFDVPPLGLPDATQLLPINELMNCDAIRLFVVRARQARTDFALTDATAASVAEICQRLDGLPLALELAAARVRMLAPPDLLKLLTNRLQMLTGGHRDAPERLQTMRQAIAWSYDLLSLHEHALFRGLSVFVGGFTLEAAQAVMEDQFSLDDLTSLVEKSLVQQTEQPDGDTRFSMLETIREFGLEQLVASGEDQSVRDRHVAYFLALAEQAEQPSTSAARIRTNQQLGEELPNFRAALAWASAQQDAVHLLRLTNALYWLFYYRGLLDEANTWQAEAVAAMTAAAPATPVLRRLQMGALTKTANAARIRGDFDRAAGLITEAAAIAREIDDPGATAEVEHGLGLLAIWQGDLEDAQPHLEVALAGWRALDKPGWIAATVNELGYCATLKGDWPNAERYFTEALDVARSSGGMEMEAKVLECLGTCARNQGDYRRAADRFAEALTLARDGSILYVTALCLKSLGVLAAHAGNAARAARLFGAWEALQERLGFADTGVLERTQIERTIAPSRAALSPEAFTAAWATGRTLPLADAVAEALDVARELMSGQPIGPDVRSRLSPREMDVLRLVVEGLSDKEIATSLGMRPRTASKHVETILNKFDVPSRTAAATYATRHGIS